MRKLSVHPLRIIIALILGLVFLLIQTSCGTGGDGEVIPIPGVTPVDRFPVQEILVHHAITTEIFYSPEIGELALERLYAEVSYASTLDIREARPQRAIPPNRLVFDMFQYPSGGVLVSNYFFGTPDQLVYAGESIVPTKVSRNIAGIPLTSYRRNVPAARLIGIPEDRLGGNWEFQLGQFTKIFNNPRVNYLEGIRVPTDALILPNFQVVQGTNLPLTLTGAAPDCRYLIEVYTVPVTEDSFVHAWTNVDVRGVDWVSPESFISFIESLPVFPPGGQVVIPGEVIQAQPGVNHEMIVIISCYSADPILDSTGELRVLNYHLQRTQMFFDVLPL